MFIYIVIAAAIAAFAFLANTVFKMAVIMLRLNSLIMDGDPEMLRKFRERFAHMEDRRARIEANFPYLAASALPVFRTNAAE